jgi:hypothetical protein
LRPGRRDDRLHALTSLSFAATYSQQIWPRVKRAQSEHAPGANVGLLARA